MTTPATQPISIPIAPESDALGNYYLPIIPTVCPSRIRWLRRRNNFARAGPAAELSVGRIRGVIDSASRAAALLLLTWNCGQRQICSSQPLSRLRCLVRVTDLDIVCAPAHQPPDPPACHYGVCVCLCVANAIRVAPRRPPESPR